MLRPVLALLLLSGFALPAGAQLSSVAPGDRVRATLHGSAHAQEFSVVALRADTLQVRRPAGAQDELLPLGTVQRLEVYRGRESRSGTLVRRAGYGAAIGAVIGGVIVAATDDDDYFADSGGGSFMVGALAGGVIGGAVGALASLGSGRERWEAVQLR